MSNALLCTPTNMNYLYYLEPVQARDSKFEQHSMEMYINPYSPIFNAETGQYLYGTAAFLHKIRLCGGWENFIKPFALAFYQYGYQMALQNYPQYNPFWVEQQYVMQSYVQYLYYHQVHYSEQYHYQQQNNPYLVTVLPYYQPYC